MARIRTIKPDYFRHERLQDLEVEFPGKYPMMVFAGLWGHCDSKGRFEWRPRQLKLDILPFLPFDMAETLGILTTAGMIRRYVVEGKEYGEIPTFEKHQRLSGKELQDGEKHPEPTGEAFEKQQGSVGEIPEYQEGKGREGNRNGVDRSPEKPAKQKKRTPFPDDFYPNESGIEAANKAGMDIALELESFGNHHRAKGNLMADWQAAWRTWVSNYVKFGKSARAGPSNYGQQRDQERKQVVEILTGKGKRDERTIASDRDIPCEATRVTG